MNHVESPDCQALKGWNLHNCIALGLWSPHVYQLKKSLNTATYVITTRLNPTEFLGSPKSSQNLLPVPQWVGASCNSKGRRSDSLPHWGCMRSNRSVFLTLSLPHPSPLSKNKGNLTKISQCSVPQSTSHGALTKSGEPLLGQRSEQAASGAGGPSCPPQVGELLGTSELAKRVLASD